MADITAEQVARLLADMLEDAGMWHLIEDAFGEAWQSRVPIYVVAEWDVGDWSRIMAALERAAPALDPLAYADSPVWDDGPLPKRQVPASEVVDVPQPIVKRCTCPDVHDAVEAEWRPGEPYLTVTHTTVPVALLRAMLEAIDAQQGGAS